MMADKNSKELTKNQKIRQNWVLWRYWMLRELKTRYAGSVLGLAWAFVQPVATLAIFYVLFGVLLAVRVPGINADQGYLLHLLAGLAVWLPFADAIGRGVGSLAAYEDFLRKQPIAAEILPAVSVGGSFPVMGVAYALLLVLALAQGIRPSPSWIWLPCLIAAQVVITLGLALILSMAHFLWRDVGSAMVFFLQLWFYLTPVVYPLSQVPEKYHAWYLLNPVACLAIGVQSSLFGVPGPDNWLLAIGLWLGVLGLGGWWFFKAMKPTLGEAL